MYNDTLHPDSISFYSFKISKGSGYYGISFNVVYQYFGSLQNPLLHICNLSIQKCVFPDELKLAKLTPIYKQWQNWFRKLLANLSSSMLFKNFGTYC